MIARVPQQLIWLVVFSLITGPWPVTAEESAAAAPLDLPALLAEAVHVNPKITAARKSWEAARVRIPQATGLPAPKIGVEWEEIPRGSFKVNQATVLYSLIQSLPFPGKLSARKRVAVADAQRAAAAYRQAEWDVLGHVKSTYYDLYLVDRELDIQQQQVIWLNQAAAAAQARYATGMAPEAELLRAQAAALEAENQITILTHRRHAMTAHLNHLLNRTGHGSAGTPGPLSLLPVPSDPEALFAQALDHQPELLVFKFSAERAAASTRLAKRELLPDLETMFELRDPAMGPIGPWDLSLALVLPFWFWTKQRYGVQGAIADQASAEAAYQAMRNEIMTQVHEHWHEAASAAATATLSQGQLLPLGRQAVGSALAAYQGGRGSFMELLEALRMLNEQERMYYQQLVSLEQHLVMLEEAIGVPLRPTHVVQTEGGVS